MFISGDRAPSMIPDKNKPSGGGKHNVTTV